MHMAKDQFRLVRNPQKQPREQVGLCWGLERLLTKYALPCIGRTETPATIDFAKEMPGPTPAFSGLSACKGCLAIFHVPSTAITRIRGSSSKSGGTSPRPAILLWPAKRNIEIGRVELCTSKAEAILSTSHWRCLTKLPKTHSRYIALWAQIFPHTPLKSTP